MKSLLSRAAVAALLLSLVPGCSLIVDTESLQSASGQFTVGLSTYWPVVGENVRAIPAGPGSGGSVNYQWFRNGMPIDGANSATIGTNGWAGNDELSLEASAGSSDPVRVGPVTVLSNEIRWRPLLPNDMAVSPPITTYEPTHRRWLNFQDGLVWEYTVEGDALVPRPLRPYGPTPTIDFFATPIMDDVNHRVLLLMAPGPGMPITEIQVLDTTLRGAENWSTIILSTPIDAGFVPAVAMDPNGQAAWIFGLDFNALTPVLTRFEFATPGAETVTPYVVDTPMPTPLPVFPALSLDPTNPDRVLVFGGMDEQDDSPFLPVGIIDIDTLAGTASMSYGAELPEARFYMQAIPDATRGEVLLLFGAEGDIDASTPAPATTLRYDPAADTFREVGEAPVVGLLGHAAPDPERGSEAFQVYPGVDITDGVETRTMQIMHGALDSDELTTAASFTNISARSGMGVAARFSGLRISGGQLSDSNSASSSVWDLDLGSMEWTEFEALDDPLLMTHPGPRADLTSPAADNWGGDAIFYFGGTTGGGNLADNQVWELHRDGFWLNRTLLPPGDPMIPGGALASIDATRGAAHWGSGCGANILGVFGGIDINGVTRAEAYMLVCPYGNRERNCYWEVLGSDGDLPQLSYSAGGLDADNYGFFWGGFDGGGAAVNRGYAYDNCSGSVTWNDLNVDASMMPMMQQPGGRAGHSMSRVEPEAGQLESWIIFGGSTDRNNGGNAALNDAFRLVHTGPTSRRAEPIEPVDSYRPTPRYKHASAWDESRRRLIVFGGEGPGDERSDVWELLIP